MMNQAAPQASPQIALTETELMLLEHTANNSDQTGVPILTLNHAIISIAKLGGYLARAHDPPPGNLILWRDLARLTDIQLGFLLAQKLVGN